MITIDCIQGEDVWLQARAGLPTASNFSKIVTSKGERSKQRTKYLYEVAGEKITGEPANNYKNANMERGNEREAESRETYEFITDTKVDLIGFCMNDEKEYGCSPDGLIGEDGGFETKDAAPHIQIERLEGDWKGTEHFQQVQGGLLVTGREWCDLVSYSRNIKPIIIRIESDEVFIRKLAIELKLFVKDLNEIVNKYSV